jgi:tetratricopeptide (TPR) repeat protein
MRLFSRWPEALATLFREWAVAQRAAIVLSIMPLRRAAGGGAMDRFLVLGATVVFAALLLGTASAVAAGPAEIAGPPASAAPPAPPPSARSAAPSHRTPRQADVDAESYEKCMKLAKDDPGAGRDMAEHWQSRGGGHPADHCYAVALVELKQYKEGATRLEKLAQAMVRAPASLRAEVLGQAAQAWLLSGDPARAYAADGAALNLHPDSPELMIDRAEAAGTAGWYDKAVADLDHALKIDPNRVEALIYRASAYRELNKLDLALADIDKAVSLTPTAVSALLERGDIRRLKGDINGARRDWVRVSELAPGTAADDAAKTNIERLEIKGDAAAPASSR